MQLLDRCCPELLETDTSHMLDILLLDRIIVSLFVFLLPPLVSGLNWKHFWLYPGNHAVGDGRRPGWKWNLLITKVWITGSVWFKSGLSGEFFVLREERECPYFIFRLAVISLLDILKEIILKSLLSSLFSILPCVFLSFSTPCSSPVPLDPPSPLPSSSSPFLASCSHFCALIPLEIFCNILSYSSFTHHC